MRLNRKEKTLVITIMINLCLILLKFSLFWFSGSLALKAGAWHSFSDVFVSSIVFMGLILARKENLQYSHGISRIENIVAIIVGLFILGVGVDIFLDVIQGDQKELTNVPVVIAGSIITIIISYFMARYKIYVGRETKSPSLAADGYHSKLDMYSSFVVVIGLIGYQIGLKNMDRVAAIIVVILVAWAGFKIIYGSISALRVGGLPKEINNNIIKLRADKWMPKLYKIGVPMFIIAYIASGFFTVRWDQAGIVKRFGRPINIDVQPGIHYKLPWPLSTVDLINIKKVRATESKKALMLTGDENLIEVEATSHYTIRNAFDYAYRISKPDNIVMLSVEAAIRQVISQMPVDAILTEGKGAIQKDTIKLAQEMLDKINTGVQLITVQLIRSAPPDEIIAAFQDVASAKEDQVTYLNEAYAYLNEIIPESRGRATQIITEAEAYREEKKADSKGKADAFLKRLGSYKDTREITRARLYIETMEDVLTGGKKMIVDKNIEIGEADLWIFEESLSGSIFKEGENK